MRVLVVDEGSELAQSYLSFLDELGHESHSCPGGRDAFVTVERWRPHVVMVNVGMSGFDCLEFVRRLQRDPELRPRLFIAIVGDNAQRHQAELARTNFDHQLPELPQADLLRAILEDCEARMMDSFIQPIPGGRHNPPRN